MPKTTASIDWNSQKSMVNLHSLHKEQDLLQHLYARGPYYTETSILAGSANDRNLRHERVKELYIFFLHLI